MVVVLVVAMRMRLEGTAFAELQANEVLHLLQGHMLRLRRQFVDRTDQESLDIASNPENGFRLLQCAGVGGLQAIGMR